MRKLIAFFLVLSLNSHAGITLVSDLDDTIKITNAGSAVNATYNGIFTAKVFTGMPTFLNEARSYVNEVHVLSASPAIVGPRIRSLLNKYEIDFDSYIMRKTFGRVNKFDYKVNAIKALLEESTDDFILLGDDVDKDPEVYDAIMKLFPNRILAAYIRIIRHREVPSSVQTYLTSFDLSLKELEANRMSETAVQNVALALEHEQRLHNVFPKFAYCPEKDEQWQWQYQTIFAKEAKALAQKLTSFCRSARLQK